MAIWIAVLFFMVLILVAITLAQGVQVEFKYWRENYDDSFVVVLRGPFRIALYRAELSLVDIVTSSEGPALRFSLARRDRIQGSDRQVSQPIPLFAWRRLKEFIGEFLPLIDMYRALWDTLIKHAALDKLIWQTQFGTGDAAVTGICLGLANALQGALFALFQSRPRWQQSEPIIGIKPIFGARHFSTSFDCIVSIRFVHVIIAQLRSMWPRSRSRKG